ncbi:MAG: serine protease [Rhodobacteraceae bacterium]|nr:serine protease [Paracoccaceae bacterium]
MTRTILAAGGAAARRCLLLSALAVATLALPAPAPAGTATAAAASGRPEIVGGRVVSEWRFNQLYPWTVALLYRGAGWSQYCGAALIAPSWLLTAAHCTAGTPAGAWKALVGTRWLGRGGRRIAVAAIIVHPDFNRRTMDSDLALMRMAEPVAGATVAPATDAETDRHAGPGARPTILGWGDTRSGGPASTVLREAQVPVVGLETCRRQHARRGTITANMLCAGFRAGGVDTCQGDSGGPLAIRGEGEGWLLVGVTSFGWGCAAPRSPGVYTRVGRFHDWIAARIAETGP